MQATIGYVPIKAGERSIDVFIGVVVSSRVLESHGIADHHAAKPDETPLSVPMGAAMDDPLSGGFPQVGSRLFRVHLPRHDQDRGAKPSQGLRGRYRLVGPIQVVEVSAEGDQIGFYASERRKLFCMPLKIGQGENSHLTIAQFKYN